jgi:hypothetical protein
MPYRMLDRHKLVIKPLKDRKNKVMIERDHIPVTRKPVKLSEQGSSAVKETLERIKKAREKGRPVMIAFGAHTIKNGLGPVLIKLIEEGWVTHLSTNGAGIIHDWELSYLGETSENVEENVDKGQFGIWAETGFNINLAIIAGAYEGLGYGESVGSFIQNDGVMIPSESDLRKVISNESGRNLEKCAAAADLLDAILTFKLKPGKMQVSHPYKKYSIQCAACRLKVPFTGHPMIGHDIIYNHPMNSGSAIGRAALRDFLIYANSVSNLEGGVYISLGSAVMSPMIFEKALSMSQNLAIQKGKHIDNHYIAVVDLARSDWDWKKQGEPPMDNPAYYLRYCKTFSRMGGTMRYMSADNRDFLLTLYQGLHK